MSRDEATTAWRNALDTAIAEFNKRWKERAVIPHPCMACEQYEATSGVTVGELSLLLCDYCLDRVRDELKQQKKLRDSIRANAPIAEQEEGS